MRSSSALFALACALLSSIASADDEPPEGATKGRIPVWGVGVAGGIAHRTYDYHIESTLSDVPSSDGSSSSLYGMVGPTANVALDLESVVLFGETTLFIPKPMTFEASFGVIGGVRSWLQYAEPISSEYVAPNVVMTEYQTYDAYSPMVIGFYGGVGVYSVAGMTGTGIDGFGYEQNVTVPSGTIKTLEAGFGLAGRYMLVAAAAFDPFRDAWGARLRTRYVLGTGDSSLFWGANVFGMSGGSASDRLPIVHCTLDVGFGDGPGLF